MLPIKKLRTSQPGWPVQINPSNPLTRGLVFAAIPSGIGFYDVVSGQFDLASGTTRYRKTIDGNKAAATSAVGGVLGSFANPTGADAISGPLTVFLEGSLETNASRLTAITSNEASNGFGFNVQFDDVGFVTNGLLYASDNNSGQVQSNFDALGTNSEQFTHRAMVTIDGTNGKWYTKGKLDKTTSYTSFPTAHANRRIRLLGNNSGAATCSGALFLVWNRALSLDEYRQLYENPWQVFLPYVVNTSLLGGSAPSGNIAADLTSISTITAALTTQITPAAALTSISTLAGALTTQITPTASLTSVSTITSGLTTQITLAAALASVSTLQGTLNAGGAALASDLTSVSTITAGLTTQITPAATLISVSTFSGSLTTSITLASGLTSVSTLSGTLTGSSASLAADLSSVSTLSGNLTTSIRFASTMSSVSTLRGTLTGPNVISIVQPYVVVYFFRRVA